MVLTYIILGALLFLILLWILGFISKRKRDEVWRQFASELGAEFIEGGFLHSSKVQARVKGCTVTLDVYSMPSGDSSTTYTRLKAPIQDMQGFQFSLTKKSLVSKLDKALGAKEIATGDAEFDRAFVVRGNEEAKVQTLFANPKIRQLLQTERSATGFLRGNMLDLEVEGDLKDIERLKSLFKMFEEMLSQLEG
jgi:hypothetical protein